MGTLNIHIDDETAKAYHEASQVKKRLVQKALSFIVRQDAGILKKIINSRDHSEEELLKAAIQFADHHRTFPLDYENQKMSREEMNER